MSVETDYVTVHDDANRRRRINDEEQELQEILRKKRIAINDFHGQNRDKDQLDDGMEVQIGLHDEQNRSLHTPIRRAGLSTPGPAFASSGGIIFPWSHDVVSLKIKPTGTNISGVHKMHSPKSMNLSVDFGNKHSHVSNFEMDIDVHPELFRLDHTKIKKPNVGGVISKMHSVADKHKSKINAFGTSFNGIKLEGKKDKSETNALATRLTNFMHKQKKNKGVSLTGASKLDFSVVGITKKKKVII